MRYPVNEHASEGDDQHDPKLWAIESIVGRARPDAHAERRRGTHRWEYFKVTGTITPERLRAHLNGGPHLGVYPLQPGTDTTRFAAFDLDDHDAMHPWSDMQAAARKLIDAATHAGLSPWPVRSGSGRGIHIWFLWDDPQPAPLVRAKLEAVRAAADVATGDAGLVERADRDLSKAGRHR